MAKGCKHMTQSFGAIAICWWAVAKDLGKWVLEQQLILSLYR